MSSAQHLVTLAAILSAGYIAAFGARSYGAHLLVLDVIAARDFVRAIARRQANRDSVEMGGMEDRVREAEATYWSGKTWQSD